MGFLENFKKEWGLREEDLEKQKQQITQEKIIDEGITNYKSQKNYLAIIGFILGIISIFLSSIGMIPILAVIFSSIGLGKSKEQGGKSMAIAGLILGIIFTFSYLYLYGHIGN